MRRMKITIMLCPDCDISDSDLVWQCFTDAAYMYDSETNVKKISDKTLCMNGVQGEQGQYRHYDVHSLYGWSQTPYTLR